MLPIGPFVLCSFGGVSTRLAVSALQCCVVWLYGGCLLWPQQVFDSRASNKPLASGCKTLESSANLGALAHRAPMGERER